MLEVLFYFIVLTYFIPNNHSLHILSITSLSENISVPSTEHMCLELNDSENLKVGAPSLAPVVLICVSLFTQKFLFS